MRAMRLVNVVGLAVGLYFLVQSYRLVRRREEDVFSFLIWLIVGTALVVVSLFPGVADYVMTLLGMEMRAYTIFTLGILLAYVLMFQLFRLIWRLNRSLSKLNEELSLLKALHEKGEAYEEPSNEP